ncbi:hypothetical protein Pint_21222 [Pistacia integerrima]|uniref:Uncharacterized protein n=1 Tax=Pistacia integerrima TaxID=434235 RepID=A0ACC0XBR1_9ROSI|nr:hypothetical protein Pint_21222 [Pistacia integerrima]
MAARGALLKYLRVNVNTVPGNPSTTATNLFSLSFNAIRRRFSEEVRGTFLDKSEVTDRVLSVVKNFQKVDPSKFTCSEFRTNGCQLWEEASVKPESCERKMHPVCYEEYIMLNFLSDSQSIVISFAKPTISSHLDQVSLQAVGSNMVVQFDYEKVTPSAHFQNDLGLDSLDTVEVVMALEEEFGFEIPDNEADKISSINLAVDFIASHPQAK